jgi:hypothetical protein
LTAERLPSRQGIVTVHEPQVGLDTRTDKLADRQLQCYSGSGSSLKA